MIVAGFGFSSRATTDSLTDALRLAAQDLTVDACAAPADKTLPLMPVAKAVGVEVVAVPPDALKAQQTQTQSQKSLETRGTGSVAEASALAAAGPGAVLLRPRVQSADRLATCALAQGKKP